MGNDVYKGGIKARTEGEFVSEFSQVLTISVNWVSCVITVRIYFQIAFHVPLRWTAHSFHSTETPSRTTSIIAHEPSTQLHKDPQNTNYIVFAW